MKTLYAITHINRDGMRQLSCANQGRHHHETEHGAESLLTEMGLNREDSGPTIARIFGQQAIGTFQIWPVECYYHGDATRTFQDDPESPFQKSEKNTEPCPQCEGTGMRVVSAATN